MPPLYLSFLSLLTLPLIPIPNFSIPPKTLLPCSKQMWGRGGILEQQPRVRPRTLEDSITNSTSAREEEKPWILGVTCSEGRLFRPGL